MGLESCEILRYDTKENMEIMQRIESLQKFARHERIMEYYVAKQMLLLWNLIELRARRELERKADVEGNNGKI